MGVGGDDSWGALPHDEFRIFPDQNYKFSFRLSPADSLTNEMLLSTKKYTSIAMEKVPDLIGLTEEEARQVIIEHGFTPGDISNGFCTGYDKGEVIGQVPEAGEEMISGSLINYKLCKGTNIAYKKPVTFISEQSNNLGKYGNDGNYSTRWCASDGDMNKWWVVDLKGNYDLSEYGIKWEFEGAYKYKIEVSEDKLNWTVAVNKSNTNNTDQYQIGRITSKNVRYIRISVSGTPGNYWVSFYEFEVYGTETVLGIKPGIQNSGKLNVFPNPVKDISFFEYSLSANGNVLVDLFDAQGIKVKTILNEVKKKGNYRTIIERNELEPGIYLLHVSAPGISTVIKVSVL